MLSFVKKKKIDIQRKMRICLEWKQELLRRCEFAAEPMAKVKVSAEFILAVKVLAMPGELSAQHWTGSKLPKMS